MQKAHSPFAPRLVSVASRGHTFAWPAWACFVLGLTTCFDGATTHLPAFGLRAGAMALCVAIWPRPQAALPKSALNALGALCVAYTWGLWRSGQPALAVQPLVTLVATTMTYAALRQAPSTLVASARHAAFGTGAMQAAWALAQRAGVGHAPMQRATGGFFSPIDLAACLAPLALWALCEAAIARSAIARITLSAQGTLMTAGLMATGSRGGVLAFLVGFYMAGATQLSTARLRRYGSHTRGYLMLGFASVVCAGVCAAAAIALRYRFTTAYDADAFSRIDIWRACLKLFVQQPQGLGTGELEAAMRQVGVPTLGAVRYMHVANNAHSTFLQTAVETGVVGVVAWCIVLSTLAKALRRSLAPHMRWHRAVGTAFFLPALTTPTWQLGIIAILLGVWAATAFAARDLDDTSPKSAGPCASVPIGSKGLWACVALLSSAALVPGTLSSVCLYQARRLVAQKTDMNAARMWAERARALAPWSMGAALVAQQVRDYKAQPLVQAEALVTLADEFSQSPEPLRMAAMQMQAVAQSPDQNTQVATLWQMTAQRDPHNALYWLYAARAAQKGHVPTDAPALYQRALDEEPHCAGAWLGLAQAAFARGDMAKVQLALREITQSASHAPTFDGFARSILTLDADAQISFNTLMHNTMDTH